MKAQLIFPMAVYVFYIAFFGLYMLLMRIRAVRQGHISPKFFKLYMGAKELPEQIQLVGRHYDNQFQLPILFFITCLAFMVVDVVSEWTLFFSWLFVISRAVHAFIHLGSNHLIRRIISYFTGWIILCILWAHLVYMAL